MKNTIEHKSLKQARKNSDISLSTMAKLLITDVSNLSKYERGIKKPNADIYLGYHLITGVALEKLFKGRIRASIDSLKYQLERYIETLGKDIKNIKINSLITRLEISLENISCLTEVKEENDE